MRLGAYLYAIPPGRYVGGEAMSLTLLHDAADHGHDVLVIVKMLDQPLERGGVRFLPVRSREARTAMRDRQMVLTHPELSSEITWVANRKMIGVVHNLEPKTIGALRRRIPGVLIANSMYTHAALSEHGLRSQVIYPPTRAPHQVGGTRRTAVFASNLSVPKGGDIVTAVAGLLPKVQFVAGLGGYGQQVPCDTSNILLFGNGPIEIPMSHAKVMLAPSRSETYGMLVAEATQAGVPVVARDLPAHREVLGDAGVYVTSDDPADWASAVSGVLASYKAHADAAAARGRFLDDRTEHSLATWRSLLDSAR